jgi:hypothetical protein
MKIDSAYFINFLDKFKGFNEKVLLKVTERGIQNYGFNTTQDILNNTLLKPLAFVEFDKTKQFTIPIWGRNLDILYRMIKQVKGNILISIEENVLRLTDEKNYKLFEVGLGAGIEEIPEKKLEKEWGKFNLTKEDIGEILNLAEITDSSSILWEVKDKFLTIRFEEKTTLAKAQLKYPCNIQDCKVKLGVGLLKDIFSRIKDDVTVYLGTNLPIKFIEESPIIYSENLMAPILEVER